MVGGTEDEHCDKVFVYAQVHSPGFLFKYIYIIYRYNNQTFQRFGKRFKQNLKFVIRNWNPDLIIDRDRELYLTTWSLLSIFPSMKCPSAAFQICTHSGYISCALCSSAQGTHSWIASKFTHGMYFGWEDQTSPFLRAEGDLVLTLLCPYSERGKHPSWKRCPFCLSDINKNNKIRNGLQLLCLGDHRDT